MQTNTIHNNILDKYLTPKQTSLLLSNTPQTVINLCKTNQLKHIKIGNKYYIDKQQFNKWRVKC